jgi:hypothetical protein
VDPLYEVTEAPRPVPPEARAELPLLTTAWRALAEEHRRRAEERRRGEREVRLLVEALAAVAVEVHRLRGLAAAGAGEAVAAAAGRLETALAGADVVVLAPAGEPYVAALREIVANVAQRPEPGLAEPRVAEVIAPAVLYRGDLLRMGQAVIAVPADLIS